MVPPSALRVAVQNATNQTMSAEPHPGPLSHMMAAYAALTVADKFLDG